MTTQEPIAGAPATASTERIVVGVDGSQGSLDALRWVAQNRPDPATEIDAVCAWQFPIVAGPAPIPYPISPHEDAERRLAQAVTEVFGVERPAGLHLRTFEGRPADVLLRVAEGATLVVVGSRGHGGVSGLLLGSVSQRVAVRAGCPVLVVHPSRQPVATAGA